MTLAVDAVTQESFVSNTASGISDAVLRQLEDRTSVPDVH